MYEKASEDRQGLMEILDDDTYYKYIKFFLNIDNNKNGTISGQELENLKVKNAAVNVFLTAMNQTLGTGELTIERFLIYAARKKEKFFKDSNKQVKDFINDVLNKKLEKEKSGCGRSWNCGNVRQLALMMS